MLAGVQLATPNVVRTAAADLEMILNAQNKAVRERRYKMLGKLRFIQLENCRGANFKKHDLKRDGLGISWGTVGPDIGWFCANPTAQMAESGDDLLFTSLMPDPPDVVDPNWIQPTDGKGKPKMIHQAWEDNASGVIKNFVVYQPLIQAVLRPFDTARWLEIKFYGGPDGRQAALLVDPYRHTAHFYGGRIEINFRG